MGVWRGRRGLKKVQVEKGWEAKEMWETGGQKVEAETWGEAKMLWDTTEIFL